jgi:hypothetical protein
MVVLHKSSPGSLLLIAMMLAIAVASACRNRQPSGENTGDSEPSGEPEQYSATIVRTVDDGKGRTSTITREARSGEQYREEWMEAGHNRALIWRSDLGKCYLLDLDERLYVELETTPDHANQSQAEAETPSHDSNSRRSDSADRFVQAIDRAMDDAPSPARVETRSLSGEVIDGHPCRVYENRASFPDGHVEIQRAFRASEYAWLALRIETESDPPATKVTTERRDVRLGVAPDTFVVPADFKKVDKLAP